MFVFWLRLGFQFVQASTAQLTQNLQGVQPMEVDAVLYLFKERHEHALDFDSSQEAGEIVRQLDQHLQALHNGSRRDWLLFAPIGPMPGMWAMVR